MKLIAILSVLLVFSITACGSKDKKKSEPAPAPLTSEQQRLSPEEASGIVSAWPEEHRMIYQQMVGKYGQPNEGTPEELIWYKNGPWNKSVLSKKEINNPLMQTAELSVPPEKMGDVALFSETIVVEAASNQVMTTANKEDLNLITLNLTKEIVNGGMSPMEARRQYSQLTEGMDKGSQQAEESQVE